MLPCESQRASPLRASDRVRCGFRQAEVADLAGPDKVGHRPNGLLDGSVGIDPVLIVKVDKVDTQPVQRCIAGRAHMIGLSVDAENTTAARMLANLVARKAWSRWSSMAFPTNSSLRPIRKCPLYPESYAELDGSVNCRDQLGILAGSVKIAHPHAAEPERRHEQSRSA